MKLVAESYTKLTSVPSTLSCTLQKTLCKTRSVDLYYQTSMMPVVGSRDGQTRRLSSYVSDLFLRISFYSTCRYFVKSNKNEDLRF